jgi:CBS domain-containing protein
MKVKDVIAGKAINGVLTIQPTARGSELLSALVENNVGALVVSNDGTDIVGIVSERDIVRHLHKDGSIAEVSVADLMTTPVFTCELQESVSSLMRTMTTHRIRHVPVIDEGALVAVVSIGDIVKNRIGELEFERNELEHYVSSSQT